MQFIFWSFSAEFLYAEESFSGNISINLNHSPVQISPYLNGAFIEKVHDFVIGSLGFAAQELQNRGFDLDNYETGVSRYWWMYHNNEPASYALSRVDMYNPNGRYSQSVTNMAENNTVGLMQDTYISNAGCDFYIYMKSKNNVNVRLKITDSLNRENVLFDAFIGNPDNNWKKYSLTIPENLNIHRAKLIIYFAEKGNVLFDESSLLPKDHINQVRREYYDLYKEWKPGIIRYPGGTVADEHAAHWFYGIGDIDKRKSPNLYTGEIQRFEVGINEFMSFCRDLNAEPQFVTNMKYGSPEESAGLIEYLNGSADTYWSRKRVEDGFVEPYNAKYFEIGNEQWDYVDSNALKFRDHASEMLKVDPNIELIFGGNLWGYQDFFDKSVDIAGDYFNNYGWHYLHFVDAEQLPDSIIYKAMMAGSQGHQKFIDMFRQWRSNKLLYNMKLSITELWTAYYGINWFFTERLQSLESGLWTADHILQFYNNYDLMSVVNHTSNSGVFERGFDENGKRQIFGTPSFYAISLLNNHSGKYIHKTVLNSPTFDVEHINLKWSEQNVPWLSTAVSSDEDSIYIAVINKHPEMSCDFSHNLNLSEIGLIRHYSLFSNDYKDRNMIDGSNKIFPETIDIMPSKTFKLKKNSLNIFAISKKLISSNTMGNSAIKVAPNPTYSKITLLNLPDDENLDISIIGIDGTIVLTTQSKGYAELTIKVSHLPPGLYFIMIRLNDMLKYNLNFIKL